MTPDPHKPVARVVIDSPLPQLGQIFDYRVPEELDSDALSGVRVRVPFRSGKRVIDGFLIERTQCSEFTGKLSSLDSVVSPIPVLQPDVWALIRRVAERQAGNPSDIIRLAVPPRHVRAEKTWLSTQENSSSHNFSSPENVSHKAPYDNDVFAHDVSEQLLNAVTNRDRIALTVSPEIVERGGHGVARWAHELAQLAVTTLHRHESAIIAVPDYRDQEQLTTALAEYDVSEHVIRMDARQKNADRYSSFLRSCEAVPHILIGNRSVPYAPAFRLGLLALWDDGDSLFHEPLAPYAHTRDVALIRQEQSGAALVFASHSRSVDVQRLVDIGFVDSFRSPRFRQPHIIPTAKQFGSEPGAQLARIPSSAWKTAQEALTNGPVLVQVARSGYAPLVACESCREIARCSHCAGPLGIPTQGALPACRYCGALATQWSCAHCHCQTLRVVTPGTGRTAEDLGRAFPNVPVIVSDGNSPTPLTEVNNHPALVIATRGAEPFTPGGYAAVLLLDGPRMLARESLRVAEECMRCWANAAALAAPGAPVFLVDVTEPLATQFATWQHEHFAATELAERRRLHFPPAIRVASIRGEIHAVDAALADLPEEVQAHVLGPVPVHDSSFSVESRSVPRNKTEHVRAIVRCEYRFGAAVSESLRSAVIRNAMQRRRVPAPKGGYRHPPTLAVRFDDPEVF